jgi:hypothetical protein
MYNLVACELVRKGEHDPKSDRLRAYGLDTEITLLLHFHIIILKVIPIILSIA